jgi:hypothetical protein
MKSIKQVTPNTPIHCQQHSAWRLASVFAATVLATAGFTAAHAQENSSHIFGHAPAGDVITIHSDTGVHRHVTADSKGRYNINTVPPGNYSVTLEKDGHTVDARSNVPLDVGRGAEVDFACPNDQCAKSSGG